MANNVFDDAATMLCLTTLTASTAPLSIDTTAYDYRRGHPASAFALRVLAGLQAREGVT